MKKMSVVFIILATITIISFQNCAKPVSFQKQATDGIDGTIGEEDGPGNTPDDPQNPDDPQDPEQPQNPENPEDPEDPNEPETPVPDDPDVIPSCSNSTLKTKVINVAFNSTNDCKWGTDGNSTKKNGYMRARHEELVDLSIPAGATLCDMELDFPEQPFVYDDHVILALNNRVLMTTENGIQSYLNSDGSGSIYDWSKLKDKSINVGGTNLYCNNGGSVCIVPNTEQNGQILIDVPKSTIQKIVTMAPQSVNQIKMVTTGDDDTGDCNHTPISFDVKMIYHD